MRKALRTLVTVSALLLVFLLSSCSEQKEEPAQFYIYYRDTSSNNLYPVAARINEGASQSALLKAVYDQLAAGGDGADFSSPIPSAVTLLSMEMNEYNLRLNFNAQYAMVSVRDELIARAAIVKTMTQLDFVSTVEFFVENQPYALPDGTVLGPQRSRNYVDLIGNGLNAYSRATITLYFSTDDGQKLKTSAQDVTYNSQNSIEQVILTRLISGPQSQEQGFATISSDTRVLSVSTMNGICSVDFNTAFLEAQPGVLPEAAVYSVVNSLTELSTISSVQITVNGSKDVIFQDHVDLSVPLTRNLDYVVKPNEFSAVTEADQGTE